MKRLFLLLFVALPEFAVAQPRDSFTARALISFCEPLPNQPKADLQMSDLLCNTYVHGLTDVMFMMHALVDASMKPCMPKDQAIDLSEARHIFSAYLTKHPQLADNSAGVVMGWAIHDAFPCGISK
jgi:hypothetical protein